MYTKDVITFEKENNSDSESTPAAAPEHSFRLDVVARQTV